jgi:hypothetical protein
MKNWRDKDWYERDGNIRGHIVIRLRWKLKWIKRIVDNWPKIRGLEVQGPNHNGVLTIGMQLKYDMILIGKTNSKF